MTDLQMLMRRKANAERLLAMSDAELDGIISHDKYCPTVAVFRGRLHAELDEIEDTLIDHMVLIGSPKGFSLGYSDEANP